MKKISRIIFIFLLFCLAPISALATAGETDETRDLSIQLSGAIGSTVSNLPEFIERLYNWSIATAAGVATVMIMIGGFLYLTSAGTGRTGKAKEIIGNAVVGLLLVLSAYLILNTISPSILSLDMPEIKTITRVETDYDSTTVVEDCPDYEREQCEGDVRCFWDERHDRCYSLGPDIGTNNHGCRTDEPRCNEGLRCIIVDASILLSGGEKCTDGKIGSPCFDNADCLEPTDNGFCSNASCLGELNRPVGAFCTADTQCASNYCLPGRNICSAETGGIAGADCIAPGPTDPTDPCGNPRLFCCPNASPDLRTCTVTSSAGAENAKCMEKLDPGRTCQQDRQCKANDCTDNTCECRCNYGENCDAPCPSSRPTCSWSASDLATHFERFHKCEP